MSLKLRHFSCVVAIFTKILDVFTLFSAGNTVIKGSADPCCGKVLTRIDFPSGLVLGDLGEG